MLTTWQEDLATLEDDFIEVAYGHVAKLDWLQGLKITTAIGTNLHRMTPIGRPTVRPKGSTAAGAGHDAGNVALGANSDLGALRAVKARLQ